MKVKSESEVTQSCPTVSDLMDCSLPGSSVHGIFQARVLEWGQVAIAFSWRKDYRHPDSHSSPSVVKCFVKQCTSNLTLEIQLFAGVSKPFRLIHSSFLLNDISLICENQITIMPDFLPHQLSIVCSEALHPFVPPGKTDPRLHCFHPFPLLILMRKKHF